MVNDHTLKKVYFFISFFFLDIYINKPNATKNLFHRSDHWVSCALVVLVLLNTVLCSLAQEWTMQDKMHNLLH